jgi:aspartate-semialdehyde dehydrogenase
VGYRVAVVGATGNVGREMMQVLAERAFPCDEVAAVASSRSVGTEVEFGDTGKMLKCKNIEHFDWAGWDIALFAAGSGPAREYAPKAAAAGCIVIDNSSLYRMDPDVPLIVPEVNPDAIDGYTARNIIAKSQLFDRAAGGGAEAAARFRHDQAGGGEHLPIGLRRGQGGDGRAVPAEPRDLRR